MQTELRPSFVIDVVGRRDRRVLVLAGELDLDAAVSLRDCIAAVRRPDQTLVVDLAGVTTIDSKGLSILVKARGPGDGIVLRAPSDAVRRVLASTDAGPFTILPA